MKYIAHEENLVTNMKTDLLGAVGSTICQTNCALAEEALIDHHGQDMRSRLYMWLLKVTLTTANLTNWISGM